MKALTYMIGLMAVALMMVVVQPSQAQVLRMVPIGNEDMPPQLQEIMFEDLIYGFAQEEEATGFQKEEEEGYADASDKEEEEGYVDGERYKEPEADDPWKKNYAFVREVTRRDG